MRNVSRRDFGKALLGGTAAGLTGSSSFVSAAPINRYVGPTLVFATYNELTNAVNLGRYDAVKVVAATTYGLLNDARQHVQWDASNRLQVCNLTRYTIVRTATGDHGAIDPNAVYNEIRPWYDAKSQSTHGLSPRPGYSNLLIELGNEPNVNGRYRDENFIWETRHNLLQAITVCRNNFPLAKIICTAIAPRVHRQIDNYDDATNTKRWVEIYANATTTESGASRNVVNECDLVGVHFYATYSWTSEEATNDNSMRFMINTYNQYVGTRKWWVLTEFGLRNWPNQSGICDDYTKGHRNAGMLHFNEGPSGCSLPSNVWGGTYYQLNTVADRNDGEGGYAYYYPNGDWNYRNRLNSGV
ncbi:hypothetical protein WME89_51795 [Sorangium sp. So ce321]|uniref:hypothetical protein n=1 Tax=Sorangium sp. So ce321 TaxID=3133300 RepID=UPI003F619F02